MRAAARSRRPSRRPLPLPLPLPLPPTPTPTPILSLALPLLKAPLTAAETRMVREYVGGVLRACGAEMPREMAAEIEADLARAESGRAAAKPRGATPRGSGGSSSGGSSSGDDEDDEDDEEGEEGEEDEEDEEGEDEDKPPDKPPAAAAAKGQTLTLTKVEQLCSWLAEHCGFERSTGTRYAAAVLTLTDHMAILTLTTWLLYIHPAPWCAQAHTLHGYTLLRGYILATTRYAEALVGEGADHPSDLAELEEGDWPSSIKPLHLKKLKAAIALTLQHSHSPEEP